MRDYIRVAAKGNQITRWGRTGWITNKGRVMRGSELAKVRLGGGEMDGKGE